MLHFFSEEDGSQQSIEPLDPKLKVWFNSESYWEEMIKLRTCLQGLLAPCLSGSCPEVQYMHRIGINHEASNITY